jgi:hypothetical protein
MPHKLDEKHRRAPHINPAKSGVRTGNPQLESHEADDIRFSSRPRKPRRPGSVKAVDGERGGGSARRLTSFGAAH